MILKEQLERGVLSDWTLRVGAGVGGVVGLAHATLGDRDIAAGRSGSRRSVRRRLRTT